MASLGTVTWPGASGKKYEYQRFQIGNKLKAEGGNYIFCKASTESGKWTAIYIGETGNLDLRFDDHHKAECITSEGATHICAHLQSDRNARLEEESDLLAEIKTPCND